MERSSSAATAPNAAESPRRRTSGGWTAVPAPLRVTPGGASAAGMLVAPTRLVAETRASFRQQALEHVDAAARDGRPTVDLDLGQTVELDAGGLGILVLVQRRARTQGLPTRLLHAREQARRLLTLTKLDYLFQFVD
jgi:ABC-type transporter Mla MlaB component